MFFKYPFLIITIYIIFSCSSNTSEDIDVPVTDANNTSQKFTEVSTIQYRTIADIDPDLLSMDIYSFEDTTVTRPVVLWVHGGGWFQGDKANVLEDKLPYFEALGYVFISVNYRLSPTPGSLAANAADRLQFPAHIEDLSHAIAWIFSNIADFGGDANNMVIMGHSAGAQLVSLITADPQYLGAFNIATNQIKGVCAFDTQGFNVEAVINNASEGTVLTYRNAFGDTPSNWPMASATFQAVSNTNLPEQFLIAVRGTPLRRNIQADFINVLESNGVLVEEIEAGLLTHNGVNRSIGREDDIIITPILTDFLENAFN